jgi:hypothetical protein
MPIYKGNDLFKKTNQELKRIGIYPGAKVNLILNDNNFSYNEREEIILSQQKTEYKNKAVCYILFVKEYEGCGKILLSFPQDTKCRSSYRSSEFDWFNGDEGFIESLIRKDDNPFTRDRDVKNKKLHWFLEIYNLIEVETSPENFLVKIESINDLILNIEQLNYPETDPMLNSLRNVK